MAREINVVSSNLIDALEEHGIEVSVIKCFVGSWLMMIYEKDAHVTADHFLSNTVSALAKKLGMQDDKLNTSFRITYSA